MHNAGANLTSVRKSVEVVQHQSAQERVVRDETTKEVIREADGSIKRVSRGEAAPGAQTFNRYRNNQRGSGDPNDPNNI